MVFSRLVELSYHTKISQRRLMNMSDNIIQLNEDLIKQDLKSLVRSSVEETLNALLDHEAEELVNAEKYERSGDRKGYRSGHYNRNFQTTAGDVTLKVPKLKGVQFETAIIERYRRRECSVEEALIEMYLAGVSVRRVEDITEALWGTKVSPGTISNLNKKAYEHIETWRTRPLTDEYPYIYVDGVYLKRSWGGEIQNVSILVAIGVNRDGCREIIGAAEGMKEDKESWRSFFVWLKERGLEGVRLIIGSDAIPVLIREIHVGQCFINTIFQLLCSRRKLHFTKLCYNLCSFFTGCRLAFLGMNCFQHHGYFFHALARCGRKDVAIKMYGTALIFRIWKYLRNRF